LEVRARSLVEQARAKTAALGLELGVSGLCAGVLTRADFERACEPLFERSVAPVVQALENANVKAGEVDELVLVGGSSRLLAVRRRLQAHFGGRELRTTVDPDLAVALGAAASRV
jgi:molecular chaperone DnaK (HSP70)